MSNRLRSRHTSSRVNGKGGRRTMILCATTSSAATCIILASTTRRTILWPRVACAYQYSPPPPLRPMTTMANHCRRRHRSHHHPTNMAGLTSTFVSRCHHHQQLWMTAVSDDDDDVFIGATMTNGDAMTTAMNTFSSPEFIEEISETRAENDVILDNLLPSMRAFTSSSKSNVISSKNNRRPDKSPVAPQTMGPSSSALFPSLLSASSPFPVVNKDSEGKKTNASSWKKRLVNVSNVASFLCILDCTLLPLFSVVMPALSWGAGAIGVGNAGGLGTVGAILTTYLPTLSHGIALYFVIPMGIVTSIINHCYGHGEWKFSFFSLVGLVLIFIANSSVVGLLGGGALGMDVSQLHHLHHHHQQHAHDACGAIVGAATSMMAHTCPSGGGEGLAHRLMNTLGCAFLLGSNYAGKKFTEKAKEDGGASARRCAASAFSEAWGGGGRGGEDGVARSLIVCGCIDCGPTYSRAKAATRREGGNFFQWKQSSERRR